MKTYGMTLDLKEDPDTIAKYKEYHRAVWPEVISGLHDLGISKMKIFLGGNRLFMYLETPDDFDPGRDFPKYMKSGQAKEWDELMRTFQQKSPAARPGEWWANMEEVFDIEWFK